MTDLIRETSFVLRAVFGRKRYVVICNLTGEISRYVTVTGYILTGYTMIGYITVQLLCNTYSQYSNLWVEVAEFGYPVPLCTGLDLERRRFELLLGRF